MRLGTWQKEVLKTLCTETPFAPLRNLRGKASSYWGRYKDSLLSLEGKGLIREVPGPKGGRFWFLLTPKGAEVAFGRSQSC